jgi:hypothetical protein
MPVTRRQFLETGLGVLVVGTAAACRPSAPAPPPAAAPVKGTPTTTAPSSKPPSGDARWSDLNPGSGNVVIDKPVVLDMDATVTGLTVTASGRLTFDNTKNVQLQSSGNIVIAGKLVSDLTGRPDLTHQITMIGVDESKFVGGGLDPLPSDVGVWVVDGGVLDLQGWQRSGWHRSKLDLAAGTNSVVLDADPVGWRVGDELVLTPTALPTDDDWLTYDSATIKTISGRTITFTKPLTVAHPRVDCGRDVALGAEVMNMTRNVVIEGTAGHRSHVFIRSTRPQRLRSVGFQYLGPLKSTGDTVLGRYACHFHHCMDDSRGSLVESCVGRKIGSHVYVPHMSNGVTFRDCISHDTQTTPYWWDDGETTAAAVYDHCVASLTVSGNADFKYSNAGFAHQFGPALSNVTHDCVAVGVQGRDSAGFFWNANSEGIWKWNDNVAHNCETYGIRTWQNNHQPHSVIRGILYRNGMGIKHGAYGNNYHYIDCQVVGNMEGQVNVQAISGDPQPTGQLWQGLYIDAQGRSTCIDVPDATVGPARGPILIKDCDLRNAAGSFVHMYHHGEFTEAGHVLAQSCTFTGSAPHTAVDSDANPGSQITVS